ncbi:MAG TPA: class I SAM-dependent methyltransferase [Acidimicrobiales bacterium]|nr:class I SAM-dependent methyltransferase [Acidimicrobiales bacterium]
MASSEDTTADVPGGPSADSFSADSASGDDSSGDVPGGPGDRAVPGLDEALDGVEGWFSPEQVARVVARAAEVPAAGRIVEIGSFRGRSMIAIARSAPAGAAIYAIDPHAGNDRGPQEIEGFEDEAAVDSKVFLTNLERAGVRERVTYVRKFSHDALDDVEGAIDLLHIDGAHRFTPARDDIRTWGARVVGGGSMLVHDSFSSVGVTLALAATVMFSGDWRFAGRSRSLAEYRREPVRGLARVANVGRQVAQVPWFVRNLTIKALIVAKLGRLTRVLGHDGANWPY